MEPKPNTAWEIYLLEGRNTQNRNTRNQCGVRLVPHPAPCVCMELRGTAPNWQNMRPWLLHSLVRGMAPETVMVMVMVMAHLLRTKQNQNRHFRMQTGWLRCHM